MSKKDKLSTESYKGVRDFYPEEQALLNYLFATCRRVAQSFGYVEYGASILEPAELYKAKGSENEEIVKEQTYTFTDRGGREVTLRPEMTPTVARMVSAKRRELGFPLRLFSIPNLFRYERPQRGRLREHWQLNVDLFGSKSPAADAEVIVLAHELMFAFGAKESDFEIRVNNRQLMYEWFEKRYDIHDEALKRSLTRIFDQKRKITEAEFKNQLMPIVQERYEQLRADLELDIEDFVQMLNDESRFSALILLKRQLDSIGIKNVVFDPTLARGFDYYTGMVFEVFDTHPENSRALFGGGRYDNLTSLFDDEPITGVGFGMGDVTIRDFLTVRGLVPPYIPTTNVYLAVASAEVLARAEALAKELRGAMINVEVDFGEKKLADQIKTAVKHAIPYLIVIGQDELASDEYTVRDLKTGEEKKLARGELAAYINSL